MTTIEFQYHAYVLQSILIYLCDQFHLNLKDLLKQSTDIYGVFCRFGLFWVFLGGGGG